MSLIFHVTDGERTPGTFTDYEERHVCLFSEFKTMRDMMAYIDTATPAEEATCEDVSPPTRAFTPAVPLYFDGIGYMGCTPLALLDVDVYHIPPGLPPIWVRRRPACETMQIFVVTISGRRIVVTVSKDASVYDLAIEIQEKEGIEPPEQRLIYAGKNLLLNAPLAHYKIRDAATVHLCLQLSGGGGHPPAFGFVDMSATPTECGTRRATEHDPFWSLITTGINLEVQCLGKSMRKGMSCDAVGKQAYIQWGTYRPWVLGHHGPQSKCPSCGGPAQLKGCIFTACKWRWIARKAGGTLDVSAPWKTSGKSQCHEFSSSTDDGVGVSTYEALMIMAYPLI